MAKKLKLPLLIDSSGHKYVLSKNASGKIDLTANDGTVYANHVEESQALTFLGNGTWTVVGLKPRPTDSYTIAAANAAVTNAEANVANAKSALNVAEVQLKDAKTALEELGKPYLV